MSNLLILIDSLTFNYYYYYYYYLLLLLLLLLLLFHHIMNYNVFENFNKFFNHDKLLK